MAEEAKKELDSERKKREETEAQLKAELQRRKEEEARRRVLVRPLSLPPIASWHTWAQLTGRAAGSGGSEEEGVAGGAEGADRGAQEAARGEGEGGRRCSSRWQAAARCRLCAPPALRATLEGLDSDHPPLLSLSVSLSLSCLLVLILTAAYTDAHLRSRRLRHPSNPRPPPLLK
jgi:hypothetical protein